MDKRPYAFAYTIDKWEKTTREKGYVRYRVSDPKRTIKMIFLKKKHLPWVVDRKPPIETGKNKYTSFLYSQPEYNLRFVEETSGQII